MNLGQIESLAALGIEFQSGHKIQPLSTLRQALWFHLAGMRADGRLHTQTFYWVECAAGYIHAIVFSNLPCSPGDLLPGLGAALLDGHGADDFVPRLQSAWLIPPRFECTWLVDAGVMPNEATLHGAILRQLDFAGWELGVSNGANSSCILGRQSDSLRLPAEAIAFMDLVQVFGRRLDAGICRMLDGIHIGASSNATISNYNRCIEWQKPAQRNRLQALEQFPWLWPDFELSILGAKLDVTDSHRRTYERLPHQLTLDAIDSGAELIPVLAKRYSVSAGTLRHARPLLKRLEIEPVIVAPLLWLLDGMKPDKRPYTLNSLRKLIQPIAWLVSLELEQDREFIDELVVALFVGGVDHANSKLAKWCPSSPYSPLVDSLDYLRALGEQAEGNGAVAMSSAAILKSWFKTAGIQHFFGASEHWHRYVVEVDNGHELVEWPACLSEPMRFGCHMVHELHSSACLGVEGALMRHCIQTYWQRCAGGRTIVFSLRDMQERHQSTLMISLAENMRFVVEQHRAFANRWPDTACMQTAQMLVEYLNRHHLHSALGRLPNEAPISAAG